jgi:hypothetical protein
MLQLQVAGGAKTPASQLSALQAREGRAAEEEFTENAQNYSGKTVLLKPYYTRYLIRGDAPR